MGYVLNEEDPIIRQETKAFLLRQQDYKSEANHLFSLITQRSLDVINQILKSGLSHEEIMDLPNMIDVREGGKSLIHKCAQVKSRLILEEIVEFYRKYVVRHELKDKE